ncbi:zinc-alpha-2-glycoprotein-like [Microcebus murinus]|uniref:zinc-alpha-2-glycoprotein-like n=1 Tax=Microcebus murinus TaxID=30608 RepID=UPI003F6B25E1
MNWSAMDLECEVQESKSRGDIIPGEGCIYVSSLQNLRIFQPGTVVTVMPVLLSLLLLLGPAVPQEAQAESCLIYSLTYLYIGVSKPGEGYPKFWAVGFLNDQEFLHYDSESRNAEPVGPWRHVEGMEDWDKESNLQQARENFFLDTLQDITNYYNDSNGSHTFQGRFGCELQNNRSSGALWKYTYIGKDFIEFNKEIPTWVPLNAAAWNTKKKWEPYVQNAKEYLEEECPRILQRYLNYSRHILDRQGTHRFLLPSTELRQTKVASG